MHLALPVSSQRHLCANGLMVPQGDAHEPEGHHVRADVRAAGRGHQRLDGRHLLNALEEDAQGEER